MAKCKVKDTDLSELARAYNANGKQALYHLLRTQYAIKNPTNLFKRMVADSTLSYDKEKDRFAIEGTPTSEAVFLSMEELCAPIVPQHVTTQAQQEVDSRPAAMDKLIRELIGDRLLELSKYVTMDSLSKRVIVDKTTLIQDGYHLITH